MMITTIDSTAYEIYDPIRVFCDTDSTSSLTYAVGEIGYGSYFESATDELTIIIKNKFHELFINESRTGVEERQYGWMGLHIREKS